MRWVEEVLGSLAPDARSRDDGARDAAAAREGSWAGLARRLGEALERTLTLEEVRDILAASSLLLHASSVDGELVLPDWGRSLRALEEGGGDGRGHGVVGLGEAGHALVSLLGREGDRGPQLRRFFLDTETARPRFVDPDTATIVLDVASGEEAGPVPRFGDLLRASYRVASGGRGLPPLVSEALEAARSTRTVVHVVVGLEEPWVSLVPDLLYDIRSFLGWGRRGTCILHLLSRPAPRLRGSFLDALREIERTKPFDEGFLILADESTLVSKVAAFIRLSVRAPEILFEPPETQRRGPFSSYGISPVPHLAEGDTAQVLSRFETYFRASSPSWVPANPVLSEVAFESVFYVHPPHEPPPDSAWKFCPELQPVALEGVETSLCRIQRGLGLEHLRIG